jgi:2-polyprenyl-6-methoxyphenol hydroxylase-like FAD-dependent oxidoreductase
VDFQLSAVNSHLHHFWLKFASLTTMDNKAPATVSTSTPFRVIVVGGGVAGLTASHCLQKAGIDHVVLERRDVVAPSEGASIAIYPHGSRILHQIGCLESVQKVCVPCKHWWMRKPDGTTYMDLPYFDLLKDKYVLSAPSRVMKRL